MIIDVKFKDNYDKSFYLHDIKGFSRTIQNGEHFGIAPGWYKLNIHHSGNGDDVIEDISINGESIRHLKYVGVFESEDGLTCPATTLWQEGVWSLSIHTNLGFMFKKYFEQIDDGDYGQKLLDLYTYTVDQPITLPESFPPSIRNFFSTSFGVNFWNLKYNNQLPYIRLPKNIFDGINVQNLISACKDGHDIEHRVATDHEDSVYGRIKKWQDNHFEDEGHVVNFENFPYEPLAVALQLIGFKKWIHWGLHELKPGDYLPMHRDDYYHRKDSEEFIGCRKFYWGLDNIEGAYFKNGSAGLLPINEPLIINTSHHTHSVVNTGANTRIIFLMYGQFDISRIPDLHRQSRNEN